MALQYQFCHSSAVNEAAKWYGWMVTGSLYIGFGAWGDVDGRARQTRCYLYNLGIALFPYVALADETGWYSESKWFIMYCSN